MKRLFGVLAAAMLLGAMPSVPRGFSIERIATVMGARELAFLPNGDLLVGTSGDVVEVVPHADGAPGAPRVFVRMPQDEAAGVATHGSEIAVGTVFGVWRIPYRSGKFRANGSPELLAPVRTSGVAQDHVTTSVAFAGNVLYASVGSSCDACSPEPDTSMATIGQVVGKRYVPIALHVRNAIALAGNENTGALWAGVAGEDTLPVGHPYEIFDDVTAHALPADYGWPFCYGDRRSNPLPQWRGHDCAHTAVSRAIFPAYETPIGAAFYPLHPNGRYAFPLQYRGGAFVTLHGSWHGPEQGLSGFVPPRVVFVPMRGDTPVKAVNWSDPDAQWQTFAGGYQQGGSERRIGRPTGIAVGPQGGLFIADDLTGAIYRIRPKR